MKKAYIIHGWCGHPDKGWKDWLALQLKEKGFEVVSPQMPNADMPKIEE